MKRWEEGILCFSEVWGFWVPEPINKQKKKEEENQELAAVHLA